MIKKSEHKFMDIKLSLSSHMDIWIGHRPFFFRKILVLLCTILPIDCLSYFSFLPSFIEQPIDINLFSLIQMNLLMNLHSQNLAVKQLIMSILKINC